MDINGVWNKHNLNEFAVPSVRAALTLGRLLCKVEPSEFKTGNWFLCCENISSMHRVIGAFHNLKEAEAAKTDVEALTSGEIEFIVLERTHDVLRVGMADQLPHKKEWEFRLRLDGSMTIIERVWYTDERYTNADQVDVPEKIWLLFLEWYKR